MRSASTRALLAIGSWALLSGCAVPIYHDYDLAPGQAHRESQHRVLLLPINETEAIPDGLEVGEENVFAQLKTYLESKGLSIETTNSYDYRAAVNLATESVSNQRLSANSSSISGDIDYASIVPGVLENLDSDADLLILSSLVIRRGESKGGRTTRWDGVRRQIDVGSRTRMTGTESVASILVTIYSRDGKRVFSGYGGLDLLFAPNIREERYELIPDRLQNASHNREGVCVAFYPYFGEDERCR